jgi:hypothetical protein
MFLRFLLPGSILGSYDCFFFHPQSHRVMCFLLQLSLATKRGGYSFMPDVCSSIIKVIMPHYTTTLLFTLILFYYWSLWIYLCQA